VIELYGEGMAVGTEGELIPLDGFDGAVEAGHRTAAKEGTRGLRRLKDRMADLILGHEPPHTVLAQQLIVEAVIEGDVVVFEVDGLEPGIRPRKSLGFTQGLQQEFFGNCQ